MSSDLLGDSGGATAEIEVLREDLVRIFYAVTWGAFPGHLAVAVATGTLRFSLLGIGTG